MRIDLVGTTADFRRPGPQNPLLLNHLPGENRRMAGRIGEVGLARKRRAVPSREVIAAATRPPSPIYNHEQLSPPELPYPVAPAEAAPPEETTTRWPYVPRNT
jgi:hypothetical protein